MLLVSFNSVNAMCHQGKGKKISVKTGDELNRLMGALHEEIVDANIYYRLFQDLNDALKEYEREFAQSDTFWSLTFEALKDAWLIRLCRVFDQNTKSLNLVTLLAIIKENLHFFNKENFSNRLKDNAFVNSLSEQCRAPDETQLEKDIEFASCRNDLVKKLMKWRNNIVAHKGSDVALGKAQAVVENPLTYSEIEILLNQGFELFNRYAQLYGASTFIRTASGQSDYKSLLLFVRLGLQKYKENVQEEINE